MQKLPQLFPAMVAFLELTEQEVPHGCQPAKTRDVRLSKDEDHYLTQGGKINKNYARHVYKMVRDEFQHEKRGRVGNLAGWQMAGKRLLHRLSAAELHDLVAKDTKEFEMDGCRVPMLFTPFFFHAFEKPDKDSGITGPQVIVYDGNIFLVMGFFMKLPRDKKTRLCTGAALGSDVKRLIGAMPFASDGVVHNFGPTSKLRDIPLKAHAEVIELDHKATGDTEGLKVVLTKAAHFAFTEVCQVTVEEKLAKFEKKMKTEAAEQLKANMIKASPIKFIDKFAFNEKSFLAKPTTEKGMAMARSGMQHVATRRVQLLGLDKDKEELKEAILRVVPIHFEREFLGQEQEQLGDL